MKIVNRSAWIQNDGTVSWLNRLKGTLQFGLRWYGELEAMQIVVTHLQRVLSGQFVLLRGLTLPGLNLEIPGVLLGPSGVYVLYASPVKGIFRIKGNRLARMDTTTRQFRDVQPNLVRRTQLMGRAVEVFFERKGVQIPELESVLVFTDPGIHVDVARPAVRIVQIDVLDRFAAQLAQGRRRFSSEDVRYLVRLLLNPHMAPDQPEKAPAEEPVEDDALALSFDGPVGTVPLEVAGQPDETEPATEKLEALTESGLLESKAALPDAGVRSAGEALFSVSVPGLGRVTMLRRQWLLLGGLAGLELILLFVLLLMVLLIRV